MSFSFLEGTYLNLIRQDNENKSIGSSLILVHVPALDSQLWLLLLDHEFWDKIVYWADLWPRAIKEKEISWSYCEGLEKRVNFD